MNIAHSPKHSPYSDVNTHIHFSVVISQHRENPAIWLCTWQWHAPTMTDSNV